MNKTIGFSAVSVLLIAAPFLASAEMLTRQLQEGMSGADVSALQSFLAADPTIYPQGLVTGYFGPLTFAAVSNFQARSGISAVGRVGPITLASINSIMGAIGGSDDVRAPIISNITVGTYATSTLVTWVTNEETQGVLYFSTLPLYMSENQGMFTGSVLVTGTPLVSANNGLRTSHAVNAQNLHPSTTYYYVIHTTDQAGNVSVTWPSTFVTKNN